MMHKANRFFLLIVMLFSFWVGNPQRTVYAQISLPADINKEFQPISIGLGGTSALTVTVFNPNGFELTNTRWTDNLAGVQPGIVIANPPNVSTTCAGPVTANPGSATLSLSGGTIPAASGGTPGSCTVTVQVTATRTGNLINTIPAGNLQATGGGVTVTNATPASATLRVSTTGTPSVSKSFDPSTVWVGQRSTLTINITNPDPSTTLTQASLADSLPTGVTVATPVTSSLTNCGLSASLSASGGSVSLTSAQIAPNSTCTIRVDVISNTRGSYLNTIPAGALHNAQNRTNPSSATARLRVQDLGVTKAFDPPSFAPGGTTTLTITLRNPTSTEYTGVNVSDTLPGTVLTIVPGSASTTCPASSVSITPPRTVSMTNGRIPAGTIANPGTCTITVQVTAPLGSATATYTNSIPANSITTNEGATNISAGTAPVTIRGSEMTGSKSFSPATIGANGNSRLRIDIFAPGDTNLTNFTITDTLPLGVTISNSSPAAISGCGAGAVLTLTTTTNPPSISLTGGTILAGARCRIDVYVTSSTPGTYVNTIPPTNITNTQNRVPSNSLTANLTVSSGTGLSIGIVKAFNPVQVFGGAASTMTVRLENPNVTALSGIAFTDDMTLLGTGMILANPVNFNTGTCGGTLTGSPGASSFSFSGGSLPAGGSCELTLSVTMTVNSNLTNRIPVGAVTTNEGATNPDAAQASLTNSPGASISKSFAPNPIAAGGFSILTITIQNTGNVPLSGLGLTDSLPGTLPAGLEIAASPAPAPTNSCNGALSANPGTQSIQLSGGSLGANSSCTIVVSVTGSTPGNYQNCIPIGALRNDQNATNSQPACDTLQVQGQNPTGITKSLIDTSAAHTIGSEVTIGEQVTYQVVVPIQPGTFTNARLVDTLDQGLAFVQCESITGAGLTASAGSFSSICQNPTADDAGGGTSADIDRRVTFSFGTLANNGAQDAPLTLTYTAIVLDIASNVDGVSLLNSADFLSDQGNRGPARTTVIIREPKLLVDKTADTTFISNGTEATITLAVSHSSASHLDAFDAVLDDPLPTGLDYVANSLDCTAGPQVPNSCVVDTSDPTKPIIHATWDVFPLNATSAIRFRVRGNASLPANGSVTNIANLAWTSLPEDNTPPTSFSSPPNPFAIERFFDPGSAVDIYGTADPFIFNPVGGLPPLPNPEEVAPRRTTLGGFLIPVTGFAPNRVTVVQSPRPAYTSSGLALEIPKIKIDIPVMGIPLRNGTWNVDWLWNEAGWLDKTAYPTFPGNSVITGHDVTADGRPGPFARIKQLLPGDYIFIHLNGYRYTYKVMSSSLLAPTDISVLRHEEASWLTLVTCDQYDVKTGTYLKRVAIRSILIDVKSE